MTKDLSGVRVSDLISIYNKLNPSAPLKNWKQSKDILISRIEKLEKIAAKKSSAKPKPKKAKSKATVKKPVDPSPQKPTGKSKSVRTIRSAAIQWLCHTEFHENRTKEVSDENRVSARNSEARSVGLPYDEIIRRIQEEFPKCATSIACLRWYAVKIRVEEHGYEGLKLPQRRPRVKPTKAE